MAGSDIYKALADAAAQKYGINPALFHALIQQESGWQPGVVSKAGAVGLTQLMPGTASGLGVKNSYDPGQNLMGGAKYLSEKLKMYNGDTRLALASYNAGSGNVAKYHGVPPFKETQAYVHNIMAAAGLQDGGQSSYTPSNGAASGTPSASYAPTQNSYADPNQGSNVISALAQRILASNNELLNAPRSSGAPKFSILNSMKGGG